MKWSERERDPVAVRDSRNAMFQVPFAKGTHKSQIKHGMAVMPVHAGLK